MVGDKSKDFIFPMTTYTLAFQSILYLDYFDTDNQSSTSLSTNILLMCIPTIEQGFYQQLNSIAEKLVLVTVVCRRKNEDKV